MISFKQIDERLQNDYSNQIYQYLTTKKWDFVVKRGFDLVASMVLLVLLSWLIVIVAILIKLTSKGPILYLQTRVGFNYRPFSIWKFRTMEVAQEHQSLITLADDRRITKIGHVLRKYRIDEIPQLWNVLVGEMSFVGPRPEVLKYVERYQPQMLATLLVKPGITSLASIHFKDESTLIEQYVQQGHQDIDDIYVHQILPQKMEYNYHYLQNFNLWDDFKVMIMTVIKVMK